MTNVVVLGMHRSGTSMVAHQLHAFGLEAGSEAELLAPREDNPAGFWERRDVVALNDEILRATGGAWFMPPAMDQLTPTDYQEQVAAIVAALPEAGWLLKDPRMLLTWPVWQPHLQGALRVLVYRGPCAVAVSLNRRNGFPLALGLALWEYYNRLVLDLAAGADVVALSYETFVRDPAGQTGALFNQLEGLGARGLSRPGRSVFEPHLQHSGSAVDALARAQALLTPAQRVLDEALVAVCANAGSAPKPVPADDLLLARIRDMAGAMRELATVRETALQRDELQEKFDICAGQMQSEQERARELLAQRDEAVSQLDATTSALADARAEAAELLQVITGIHSRLLSFELSLIGRLQRALRRVYAALRLRVSTPGAYEDVLAEARMHFSLHHLQLPGKVPGKLSQLSAVCRYIVKHPVSSFRGVSVFRLQRALEIMIRSTPADFSVWVQSRFPEIVHPGEGGVPSELGPELDTLELEFPAVSTPLVSIIVPVYNSYRMTMHCLASILEHTLDVSYEVVLADDHSTDATASIGQRVRNIRILRSEKNQGFLLNCNGAAATACGRYLVFLNNDTAVCKGWLQPMLTLLEQRPDAGVVGPRLLFPDGKLQEAGGIIWRDGSGWNYGRCDDPRKPEYEYVKEVDYVSGACLMLPRALWSRLGGFDTRFAPAYYEDTDLCFAVRQAGYKVLYQPQSSVFHYEGVSNGTDPGKGVKRFQARNREIFCAKWQAVLEWEHFANAEHVFLARDRSRARNCILVIDHYVPHYDKDAGSRSTLMYIRLMVNMGFKVVFLGANFFPHQPYTRVLQEMGVEVLVGEYSARYLDRWLHDNARYIHRIFLHRPHVAEQFLPHIYKMRPRPKIVFFGHDLHYLRVEREQELLGEASLKSAAMSWKAREFAVFEKVDVIYYPSSIEVQALHTESPTLNVRAIPLYIFDDIAVPDYDPVQRQDILFVAGFNHPPNVDGLCWFVEEVMPLLASQCPGFHLHVVGSNPTEAVLAMQSAQVTVHGYISDQALAELYRSVGCSVVPLRYGAGVKGKVLEAIQHGVPLVTTSIGAEGIPGAADIMFVADSARSFGDAIVEVLAAGGTVYEKLDRYGSWLHQNFGREQAEKIILEDFGPVASRFAGGPDNGGRK
ncbi:glycosyltransferase [Haliea sp. E1-2-M8]|uniref:glycosyltransferase n=1 Tax=Haliea sp. E1-2-M8 TaxID=3064706 RepID=UPI00271F518F|nr:glycosyltransferase [Haliea sp. E1-2-M8]MDO8862510.1 glycosyltransferase [Haliea sp. E1-2-M8]